MSPYGWITQTVSTYKKTHIKATRYIIQYEHEYDDWAYKNMDHFKNEVKTEEVKTEMEQTCEREII